VGSISWQKMAWALVLDLQPELPEILKPDHWQLCAQGGHSRATGPCPKPDIACGAKFKTYATSARA
jgi:hypothetical protein